MRCSTGLMGYRWLLHGTDVLDEVIWICLIKKGSGWLIIFEKVFKRV